jgi:aspartate aminotransferase
MTLLANRLTRISPSPTLAMSARAAELKAQGQNIINLSTGEPDFDTPDHIKQAAIEAMQKGLTKYTLVEGTLALRKAIQDKFLQDNNLTYGVDQITVGNGAKQVIFNALLATVNEGDEVIIPAPYWVSYPDMVHVCGGTPIIVHCTETDHFKLTATALEAAITPKTKWLILNSPSNPTGRVYLADELKSLAEVLERHPHVYVICDDIYEYLMFDELPFTSLGTVARGLVERILTVNGVSKSYAMTGWRIGYGAGPKILIKAMSMLQSHSTSNACSISQSAATKALTSSRDFIKDWVQIFQDRRAMALKIINDTPGLSCAKPEGAFYLYISCAGIIGKTTPQGKKIATDNDFALYLLEEAGVASVSGDAFGLSPYFRISYALDTELLKQGCLSIQKAVQELH